MLSLHISKIHWSDDISTVEITFSEPCIDLEAAAKASRVFGIWRESCSFPHLSTVLNGCSEGGAAPAETHEEGWRRGCSSVTGWSFTFWSQNSVTAQ